MNRFKKTKFYSAENSYLWVRSIGQYWKICVINILMACVFIDILAFVVLLLFYIGSSFVWYLFFIFLISLVIFYSAIVLMKRSISCLACGYSPSKSKKTGKANNALLVDDRLLKLEQCPDCSFQKSHEAENERHNEIK